MPIKPRIIIHGGAGNITRQNLPYNSPDYHAYLDSLRAILQTLAPLLPHTSALDLATHAVRLLEDNPLFNAGKGAVFNSAGVNELEASVMLSRGAEKRGVGMTLLTRVKNPVLAAREFLIRGEEKEGGSRHNFLSGPEAEKKAEEWGCEIVHPAYFWTEKRWKDHLRVKSGEADMKVEYHPLGTVGCVALDKDGTLCVATSTGGLTNKLPGRVGDTPTLGAGFWAEEWEDGGLTWMRPSIGKMLLDTLLCGKTSRKQPGTRAVAMSGTGNGDFFLRFQACHLVACRMRFGKETLVEAVKAVAGRGGEIDDGASGQAGIIGIELVDDVGNIVWDLNCGGMCRLTCLDTSFTADICSPSLH